MKKTIVPLLLILSVLTGAAFSQTRKTTNRNNRKPVRKTRVVIKPMSTPIKSPAVTTASGLTYIITESGKGAPLKAGNTVTVHYTGLLTNGTKFDSSLDRNEPITFLLGAGRVIKGWDEGLQKLRVGDRATFFIPPQIGYGARGTPDGTIPPNATLIFIVEVVGVK